MNFPEHDNGHCTKCGSEDMMLAEDQTQYSPCEFVGVWQRRYTDIQASDEDGAVRFFCRDCGASHAVPKELV